MAAADKELQKFFTTLGASGIDGELMISALAKLLIEREPFATIQKSVADIKKQPTSIDKASLDNFIKSRVDSKLSAEKSKIVELDEKISTYQTEIESLNTVTKNTQCQLELWEQTTKIEIKELCDNVNKAILESESKVFLHLKNKLDEANKLIDDVQDQILKVMHSRLDTQTSKIRNEMLSQSFLNTSSTVKEEVRLRVKPFDGLANAAHFLEDFEFQSNAFKLSDTQKVLYFPRYLTGSVTKWYASEIGFSDFIMWDHVRKTFLKKFQKPVENL